MNRNYLTWQYKNKPKARQTLEAIYDQTTETFKTVLEVADVLNVEKATGFALDLVGRHVGVYRDLQQATDKQYFGFSESDSSLGFNEGEFYILGDSLSKTVSLNDDDYRFFIKAKILKNYQTGTVENITHSVKFLCGKSSGVIDNLNMTMKIIINQQALSDLTLYAIKKLDILVRPVGVFYNFLILTTDKPFGFFEDDTAFGFDEGAFVTIEEI